ncbi:hypothetical protein [Halomonas piscis]|uniref:hypothetical protein n=1 Tax=Halomonas piscis TaxID=3031727 RepID=UPI0028A23AC7|nr:hypothetical protein [Halomonas piscis]
MATSKMKTTRRELAAQLEKVEQALETTLEELSRANRKLEEQRAQRDALRLQLQELEHSQPQAEPQPQHSPSAGTSKAAPGQPLALTQEQRLAQLKHSRLLLDSDWFDAEWYLATYPDVKKAKKYSQAPHEHYLMYGGFEGRNPCAAFWSAFYLATYADVAASKTNPLVHYLLHGRKEGRRIMPKGAETKK